ncbi:MAG: hypothetical protein A2167_00345 [Planctomycetes bacterium RBG_13_46_10]|nr:MAG: hypothetical protein A2167_00345 [Planctomycetes bacterium RBG_13_46_10]
MVSAIVERKDRHRGKFIRTWLSVCIVLTPVIDALSVDKTTSGLLSLQLIKGILLAIGILLALGLNSTQLLSAFNTPAKIITFYMVYILASSTVIFRTYPLISLGHMSYFLFAYVVSVTLARTNMIDITWIKRRAVIVILTTGIIQVYYYFVQGGTSAEYGTTYVLGGSRGAVAGISEMLTMASTVFVYDVLHRGRIVIFLTATLLSICTLRRTSFLATLVAFSAAVLVDFRDRRVLACQPIVSVTVLILTVAVFLNLTPWGAAMRERVTDVGGSGRVTLISLGWNMFCNSSVPQKMLGEPGLFYDKTESLFGVAMGTHLEFLDILLNYGMFGLAFLCSFYVVLLRQCARFYSNREEFYSLLCASIVLFIITLLSGGGTFVPKNIMFCVIAGCSYGILAQTSALIPQVKIGSLSVLDVRQKRIY